MFLCIYLFYYTNDGLYGKLLPDCSVPAMEGKSIKRKIPMMIKFRIGTLSYSTVLSN